MRSGVLLLLLGAASLVSIPALATAPSGLYSVLGDGTVKDNKTGLLWQREPQYGAHGFTYIEAMSYCASLSLGGVSSGWRLPNKLELETLVDVRVAPPGPTIDQTAFPGTPGREFWTSTPMVGDSGFAWLVYFGLGYAVSEDDRSTCFVRCVR